MINYLRTIAAVLLLATSIAQIACARELAQGDNHLDAGESIYLRGVLGSGKPLIAQRNGMSIEGRDAACVNCHRRSGFGAKEGRITVPPVTGQYLFSPREDADLPYLETMRIGRDPYNDKSLASAIRDGHDVEGRPLDYLMPRFELNETDMAALIAYLKRLDKNRVRGVTDTVLHFATIITPDADPVKRQGMLDVIEKYFANKNAVSMGPKPRLRTSRKVMFMVHRRWQLHVWPLAGPADTWEAQLNRYLAKEPVFAVVSGLGGSNWAPVHSFCERNSVPCLFPNIEAPPAIADSDFYSLYFSRGVLLEAGLIANQMFNQESGKETKVVHQIFRTGDSGEIGAQALTDSLKQHGITVHSHALSANASDTGLTKALHEASHADALMLWLRPDDIAQLDAPPESVTIFMSGLMGGLERSPLPADWRERARFAYPFDLPEDRRTGITQAFGWFRIRKIPVVAEQVQADTYLACGLLAETLSYMADTFVPDYLIERVEEMIDRRIITGYYPHLTLASGQRFASKGGYVVHFPEAQGTRVIADQEWFVP